MVPFTTILELQWKFAITCYSTFILVPCIFFWIRCFWGINIGRIHFVQLSFDIGFWYCKVRQGGRPGIREASDCIWNLKTSLPTRQSVHTDSHHAHDVFSHCSCNTHFHTSSQESVSRQTQSHFWDITWPAQLPDCIIPRLLPLGLCQKQGTQNSSQKCWLTTVNLGVYSRDPLFPQDCWSVLNDMTVVCNLSHSNSNDYH